MPDLPADVVSDVSTGLKALSVLCENFDDPAHIAGGVGVLCRFMAEKLEHAAGQLLDAR